MPRGSEIETTAAAPVAAPAAPAAPAAGASKKAAPAAGTSKKVAPAAPAARVRAVSEEAVVESAPVAEQATARPPEDPALLLAAQKRLGNVRKLREEAQIGPVTAGTKAEREARQAVRQFKEGSILPAAASAKSAVKHAYESVSTRPLPLGGLPIDTLLAAMELATGSTGRTQYRLARKLSELAGFEETPAPTYDGTQYPSVKPEVVTRAKPGQFGQTEATIIPDRPPQTPSETALNRPVVGAREALDIGRAYTRALGQEKWARSLIDERLSDPDSTPDEIRGAAAARQVALKEVARLRASLREYGWMDDEEVEKTFGAPK